jgi:hypothetical protein
MKERTVIFLLLWTTALAAPAQTNCILVSTLNCYAFFGGRETHMQLGQPQTSPDYWRKARNLVGLWPAAPPLLIGLEEIGGACEAVYLSQFAAARYQHAFQPVFAETRDTFTGEAVGAILDLDQGWHIAGRPGRDPELDKNLSKHLVVKLTNNSTALEICVVHLRRGIGKYGLLEQRGQNTALKDWAARRLAKNPQENLVILGDFNETKNVGDPAASVAVLAGTNAPLRDAFSFSPEKIRTHANGRAYDRILFSPALADGAAGLKFEKVFVQPHTHGKGAEKYWFTDHFPVTAVFGFAAKK